jgi:hypothetical protein
MGAYLTEESARQLEEALTASTTLHALPHEWNTMDLINLILLFIWQKALPNRASLQVLYLCGDAHIDWTALRTRPWHPTHPSGNCTYGTTKLNDKGAIQFASFLAQESKSCQIGRISERAFGSAGANALIQAANQSTTIQALHLTHDAISQVQLDQINSLQALHLDSNVALDIGLIANAIASNIHLEELSLTQCQVTLDEFLPLAHSLRTNSHLLNIKTFRTRIHWITRAEAAYFMSSLARSPTIHYVTRICRNSLPSCITLQFNRIQDDDCWQQYQQAQQLYTHPLPN